MVRWLRMVAELEADARVQQMHRANVAKRHALRERRRALMLARRNKHLPIAWESVEAVEVNAAEWLDLRIAEAIRRIESTGRDWLDYLQEHDANADVQAEFMRVWCDGYLSDKQPEAESYSVADGITVLHPNTLREFMDLGDHWTKEIIAQQVAENKGRENPHIIAAKALAEQAKAMYDAAMNFDNAA
ncbi:hypothetical protein ACOXQX_004354 [Escherichia coli O169]